MKTRLTTRIVSLALAMGILASPPLAAQAPGPGVLDNRSANRGVNRDVPRQLQLIVEPGRLLASNIRLGRIDEWPLDDGEAVSSTATANAVLAAATGRRLLAYGPVIGWREFELKPGERIEAMEAEDYALFVTTDRRYLNFSADTGIWAEIAR